jgi:hypothetical protein
MRVTLSQAGTSKEKVEARIKSAIKDLEQIMQKAGITIESTQD